METELSKIAHSMSQMIPMDERRRQSGKEFLSQIPLQRQETGLAPSYDRYRFLELVDLLMTQEKETANDWRFQGPIKH